VGVVYGQAGVIPVPPAGTGGETPPETAGEDASGPLPRWTGGEDASGPLPRWTAGVPPAVCGGASPPRSGGHPLTCYEAAARLSFVCTISSNVPSLIERRIR
jgi:hypothetical protein